MRDTWSRWGAIVLSFLLVIAPVGVLAAPTVPGAVYSDGHASGVNKPLEKIQQDLQKAGIKDVAPDHWAAGSITILVEAGLLSPSPDGSFQPEQTLSTFDGVAVFAKVLGIASKSDPPEAAFEKMKSAGLVSSLAVGDQDMTRLEAARLLALALGVEPLTVAESDFPFTDYGALGNEHDRGILAALYNLGVFKGYADKSFRPDNVLTRAELAILVDRILGGI